MESSFRTTGRARLTDLLVRRMQDAGRGPDDVFTVAELRRSLLPYPVCREALGLASKAEYDVALLRLLYGDELLVGDDPELDEDVADELASPEPALGFLDGYAPVALRPGTGLKRQLRAGGAEAGEGGDAEPAAGAEPEAAPEEPSGGGPDGAGAGTSGGGPVTSAGDSGSGRGGSVTSAGDSGPGGGGSGGAAASGAGGGGAAGAEPEAPPGTVGRDADRDEEGPADVSGVPSGGGACAACGGELPEAEGVRFCPHCGEVLEALRCRGCGEDLAVGWRYCPFCGSERHA